MEAIREIGTQFANLFGALHGAEFAGVPLDTLILGVLGVQMFWGFWVLVMKGRGR